MQKGIRKSLGEKHKESTEILVLIFPALESDYSFSPSQRLCVSAREQFEGISL